MPQPPRQPDAPIPHPIRHRKRVMRVSERLFETLTRVAELLRNRYRSHEAADALELHQETLGECRSPADLREEIGEILETHGASRIKPPQLAVQIETALRHLFAACDPDASDSAGVPIWPVHLLAVADLCGQMLDPYAAATCDLARLPTGTYLISLVPVLDAPPQLPAASNSKSVVPLASFETSTSVAKSSSGKVKRSAGAAATTICAPT